jgi:hypothetical protein
MADDASPNLSRIQPGGGNPEEKSCQSIHRGIQQQIDGIAVKRYAKKGFNIFHG